MRRSRPGIILVVSCLFLSACQPGTPAQAPVTSPAASVTAKTATPVLDLVAASSIPGEALLFLQDFEAGPPEAGSDAFSDWEIIAEDSGNHIYCLEDYDENQIVYFGRNDWADYAVETRVKALTTGREPHASLSARFDPFAYLGYYGALNFQDGIATLAYNDPYQWFGQQIRPRALDTWYELRLELAGESIAFFLDDELVASGTGAQRSRGNANISTTPGLQICIDDVRAWALDPDGAIDPAAPRDEPPAGNLEVVRIYAEVWSYNGADGQSYEYKVNCTGDYPSLETCFLWDLDQVVVTSPGGQTFQLEKDFNIQSYSGEVTRRWVLYGQPGEGLPETGLYVFTFIRDGVTVLVRSIAYERSIVPIATNVVVTQVGGDLHVSWKPPEGITPDTGYKVLVYEANTWVYAASMSFPGDSHEATLPNPPLVPGRRYELNVMLGGNHGYSASEHVFFTWIAP